MKIRTQSILAIVPIFIGVAAINGFLTYTSEQQENRWALGEESVALTVAVAEFIDADRYEAATTTGRESDYLDSLELYLRRLLQWEQVKFVLLRSVDGQDIVQRYSNGFPSAAHQPLPASAVEQLQDRDTWSSDIRIINADISVTEVCTRLTNSDQVVVGLVCVGVSANDFLAQRATSQRKVLTMSIAVVGLGLLLALLISSLITNKIRQLTVAAETVAEGDYGQRFDIGTIQEVYDLSNTFNTMSSVMGETLLRAKRTLMENERFRTMQTLARTYQALVQQDIDLKLNGVEIAGKLLSGDRPSTDFLDSCRTIQGAFIILGRLEESATSRLDNLLTTSSAITLLKQLLTRQPPETAIAHLTRLYQIQTLHCIFVDTKSHDDGLLDLGYWYYSGDRNHLDHEQHQLKPGHPWLLHTFKLPSDILADRIDIFLERFGYLSAVEIIHDLQVICTEVKQGGMLIAVNIIPELPDPSNPSEDADAGQKQSEQSAPDASDPASIH
jgi:HAMP domain-containing protein